jgi:hypothetical protein
VVRLNAINSSGLIGGELAFAVVGVVGGKLV